MPGPADLQRPGAGVAHQPGGQAQQPQRVRLGVLEVGGLLLQNRTVDLLLTMGQRNSVVTRNYVTPTADLGTHRA